VDAIKRLERQCLEMDMLWKHLTTVKASMNRAKLLIQKLELLIQILRIGRFEKLIEDETPVEKFIDFSC